MSDAITTPEAKPPSIDERIREFKLAGLETHRESIGAGNELVKLLEDAVNQMKSSHARIQNMSTAFFIFGLLVMGLGVYMALFGGKEASGAFLGVGGGLASLVTIFYTGPLTRIAASITNLIKLETAFLGYIRVVGEVDSAFQWQYMERIDSAGQENAGIALMAANTAAQISAMMESTMKLIDQYVADETPSVADLRLKVEALTKSVEELKLSLPAAKQD